MYKPLLTVKKLPRLKLRRLYGQVTRILFPQISYCSCCGISWTATKAHVTQYTESSGCFVLCEWCWLQLTMQERMPYYQALVKQWEQFVPIISKEDLIYRQILIELAVLGEN